MNRSSSRTATVNSSKATESLHLQIKSRPISEKKKKRESERHKTILQKSARSSADKPKQRRIRRWQPSHWTKGMPTTRARTSYPGGLEMQLGRPAVHCLDSRSNLGDTETHAPAQSLSWLRWDKNPAWAGQKLEAGSPSSSITSGEKTGMFGPSTEHAARASITESALSLHQNAGVGRVSSGGGERSGRAIPPAVPRIPTGKPMMQLSHILNASGSPYGNLGKDCASGIETPHSPVITPGSEPDHAIVI
jgi:hypothetical protein